jgi:hypothetical protein
MIICPTAAAAATPAPTPATIGHASDILLCSGSSIAMDTGCREGCARRAVGSQREQTKRCCPLCVGKATSGPLISCGSGGVRLRKGHHSSPRFGAQRVRSTCTAPNTLQKGASHWAVHMMYWSTCIIPIRSFRVSQWLDHNSEDSRKSQLTNGLLRLQRYICCQTRRRIRQNHRQGKFSGNMSPLHRRPSFFVLRASSRNTASSQTTNSTFLFVSFAVNTICTVIFCFDHGPLNPDPPRAQIHFRHYVHALHALARPFGQPG